MLLGFESVPKIETLPKSLLYLYFLPLPKLAERSNHYLFT